MLVSFGFSRRCERMPFVGASDNSFGFNPSTGTFYHGCQSVYSASSYSLGGDSLLEFDVFVDVMVGYFWVVNKRGEVLSRSGLFFELRLTNRDREHGSASSSSGRCDQGKGGFFAHGVFGLSVREHFITRGWFIAPRSDFSHAHHFPPQ